MRSIDQGVEQYGCFKVLEANPYKLQLVRALTEDDQENNCFYFFYKERVHYAARSLCTLS
jgi:hypothetical protein